MAERDESEPPWWDTETSRAEAAVYQAAERRRRAESRAVSWTNRRIFSEKFDWPAGVLTACEEFDDEFPAWSTWYTAGTNQAAAGFYARPRYWPPRPNVPDHVYGATAKGLRAALRRQESPVLRNSLFLHAARFPNHDVGVVINGTFVEIEGVHESGDPAAIVLELDEEALAEALKAGASGDQPG